MFLNDEICKRNIINGYNIQICTVEYKKLQYT